jgi:hypothetical protein
MPTFPALTVNRGNVQCSRELIRDSRMLIAAAKALIAQSHLSLARQSYIRIVCAWCHETMRFERAARTARGQISHSICFDCFTQVFWELDPRTTPLPLSTHAMAGDPPSPGLQLREDARRTGGTDTMADLARYRALLGHPANTLLTPCTCN